MRAGRDGAHAHGWCNSTAPRPSAAASGLRRPAPSPSSPCHCTTRTPGAWGGAWAGRGREGLQGMAPRTACCHQGGWKHHVFVTYQVCFVFVCFCVSVFLCFMFVCLCLCVCVFVFCVELYFSTFHLVLRLVLPLVHSTLQGI